jgi:hypothetical protein
VSTLLYPRDPIHKASATNASVTRLLRTLGSVGRAECASQGGHQRRSRRNITRTRSKTGTTIDTVTKIGAISISFQATGRSHTQHPLHRVHSCQCPPPFESDNDSTPFRSTARVAKHLQVHSKASKYAPSSSPRVIPRGVHRLVEVDLLTLSFVDPAGESSRRGALASVGGYENTHGSSWEWLASFKMLRPCQPERETNGLLPNPSEEDLTYQ